MTTEIKHRPGRPNGVIVEPLVEDARLIKALVPYDGPVEIYVITLPDGKFYIGQHKLPDGVTEDTEYLGSGRRLPLEGRVKYQLLRVPKRWADLIEELLVTKYRQELKPLCLNASIGQMRGLIAAGARFNYPQR
jgi:hypothetical protein